MSRRTRASRLGASRPGALGPISESPVPASIVGKFSAVRLDASSSPPPAEEVDRWEVRPGGMLVQKRDSGSDDNVRPPPPPPIRVRVKYGGVYHEIRISPQATFGELKKLLAGETGLHPQGQKLLYKDKERDSAAFLDTSGVKDGSKVVLVEDPSGQARRSLELRRSAKMEMAARSVHQIARDVDKLAAQVTSLESLVSKGKKVAESDVVGLTEQLMNQVLKLDAVVADGEVKMQRRFQVKRVQKFVETLDVLKVKNAQIVAGAAQQKQQRTPSQPQFVVTTEWEPFDLLSSNSVASTSATSTTTAPATVSAAARRPPVPPPPAAAGGIPPVRFNWELF